MTTKTEETDEGNDKETPQVFVTPIMDRVGGQWYEIAGPADMKAAMDEQHENADGGDIFAADSQGIPRGMHQEYGLVEFGEKIQAYLDLIDEVGGKEVADVYVEHFGDAVEYEDWSRDAREKFAGVWSSKEEYAWEVIDMYYDMGDIPTGWIDTDAVVRQLEHDTVFERLGFEKTVVFRWHL
jgi:hypothetical protein